LKVLPDHPVWLFQREWLKLRIGDLLHWELFNLYVIGRGKWS
jgi:hypothetical protein